MNTVLVYKTQCLFIVNVTILYKTVQFIKTQCLISNKIMYNTNIPTLKLTWILAFLHDILHGKSSLGVI